MTKYFKSDRSKKKDRDKEGTDNTEVDVFVRNKVIQGINPGDGGQISSSSRDRLFRGWVTRKRWRSNMDKTFLEVRGDSNP